MTFNDFVKGPGNKIDEYIGWLLASSAYIKSAHLETKSYARHKAYDFYYNGIRDLTDTFSEQWLGYSGQPYIANLPDMGQMPKDTIVFLDTIIEKTDAAYSVCPRALQAVLDEIAGLAYQTKYLLTLE
ncbi:starvation-inducible transcriptional regulator [Edwardsiella phage PEi20]|uniref:Uncharacterized protein n=1 Tax=Edwardsiella phage PEi20 TaxID=1608310 RepID=A0A0B6VTN7_9CAUD|nr:starvation-inducible transcriptional regulator [Edwardsiella phage PEi20]BAQ22761.1 conserved hypothetical protein [Edwardsiella phage PEi20]